jgi:hypothetical protein
MRRRRADPIRARAIFKSPIERPDICEQPDSPILRRQSCAEAGSIYVITSFMLRQSRELEQSKLSGFRRFAIRHSDRKWESMPSGLTKAFARIGEVKNGSSCTRLIRPHQCALTAAHDRHFQLVPRCALQSEIKANKLASLLAPVSIVGEGH